MAGRTVRVKVWDGWVRLFHWSIVLLVAVSYATAKLRRIEWHMLSGCLALALVLFRIAWGFLGSETARFARFLAGPRAVLHHAAALLRGEDEARPGHNPAGGWMVVLLLALLLAQGVTGLFADDAELYRGPFADWIGYDASQRVSGWHARIFDLLLIAVALHVAAVATYRIAFGRRLVGAMVTGSAQFPADSAAARTPPRMGNRVLAALLLGAAAAMAVALWRLALF
ncbi:hydrogenase [Roseomonas eburnea]|uniref:Hydrogenase n=1 Tax=Neoroseomonas eburnea TaxID=1346889 RepID=A0A9X9XHK8_9PROT|nr:cytochrome b/b6 domain-containing protein [Neoroseomonas eburnea]MBR0683194.1 hydrogenase [Neoroseomonas eburnea]